MYWGKCRERWLGFSSMSQIHRADVLSYGSSCFLQHHWMHTICLGQLNECKMHILHAHIISKVWTCLSSVSRCVPVTGRCSQDNGAWKPHPVLFTKQLVLAELLHHSFKQWHIKHVMGVPHILFVFPVSRVGSGILKDWNACYRYLHAHARIFCSLVMFKVNSQD